MSPAIPWDEGILDDESYADFAHVDADETDAAELLRVPAGRDLDSDDPVAA